MQFSDANSNILPEGGLATQADPPIFLIDYRRLAGASKKLGEKKVLAFIKEAYLTGHIDHHIKRVLLRLPVNSSEART